MGAASRYRLKASRVEDCGLWRERVRQSSARRRYVRQTRGRSRRRSGGLQHVEMRHRENLQPGECGIGAEPFSALVLKMWMRFRHRTRRPRREHMGRPLALHHSPAPAPTPPTLQRTLPRDSRRVASSLIVTRLNPTFLIRLRSSIHLVFMSSPWPASGRA
jgi:hypothetical protein